MTSSAADLNNAGQIVGVSQPAAAPRRAVFWPAPGESIVTLAAPERNASATAINERGEIVGSVWLGESFLDGVSALFWPSAKDEPVVLATLGGSFTQPIGIDNTGRIVGLAMDAAGVTHAVLWPRAGADPIDLGMSIARAVNARGTVVGEAGGAAATSARLFGPIGVAVDGSNNLYIADEGNGRIRKVDSSGMITTVAGNGS